MHTTHVDSFVPSVYGIGLDDCFIIMGAYSRSDPRLEPLERIRNTMLEVGASITATTLTTMSAFMLGKFQIESGTLGHM